MAEIRVRVKLMSGEWKTIEVPSSMNTAEFIRQTVDALNLTKEDQRGDPTVWSLDNKRVGQELDNTKTLEENLVADDDELILTRKVIAGRRIP